MEVHFFAKVNRIPKSNRTYFNRRKVSASEALELGLILKKVDPNQLIQEAKKFANEIAKKPTILFVIQKAFKDGG